MQQMAGNNGGPWGGGGNNGSGPGRGDGGGGDDRTPPRRPGQGGSQMPELDDLVNKGREQLRVLMGGRSGNGGGDGGGGGGFAFNRGYAILGAVVLFIFWLTQSVYTVRPEEQSVELLFGECNQPCIGQPGLNFAPWPIVTHEVIPVTREQSITIGQDSVASRLSNTSADADTGLMLTGDENIVDMEFQVVWNISQADQFLFNLAQPAETVEAVAESAMREVIAQSELAPILNRDRGIISDRVMQLTQETLNSYDSGVNIIRINLNAAEPPATAVDVINLEGETTSRSPLSAYRDVQDASQERDQLQNQADAYANRVLAQARGNAAQIQEAAEGYRARVVNEAQGEASRFLSVLEEYSKAPDVTRQRLYLEMVEEVFGNSDIILLDDNASGGGSNVVPYLPLDQVRRNTTEGSN